MLLWTMDVWLCISNYGFSDMDFGILTFGTIVQTPRNKLPRTLFRTWIMDIGLWTMDFGLQETKQGHWISDFRLRNLDFELWTSNYGLWTKRR